MAGKTLPFITKSELSVQDPKKRVLVTLNHRKVYDVTQFLETHPGGGDLIENYAGKDVSEIMTDVDSHDHSETAYALLEQDYLVAILATDEEEAELMTDSNRYMFSVDGDSEAELSVTTNFDKDYEVNKFLDLNKPLLLQVLFSDFTKEFYIEQVHKPRHYGKGSAPIFGNFLEPLSKTPWWLIPILWIPVDFYIIYLSSQVLQWYKVIGLYAFGLFLWTLIEYCLHRFLFHIDAYLPDHPAFFTLHFLLHGVHHYLPMDRMRLVLPPALLMVLCPPFYKLAHALLPYHMALAAFAGGFMGYILYDCTHYFLHHVRLPWFMKGVKQYHLDHHYKNYELGFGVTSKFWDVVFGTELVNTSKKR